MKTKDPNRYVKTYFRINSGYIWGQGHPPERAETFKPEVKQLLESIGFQMKQSTTSGGCQEGFRGGERLYCHPMDLSGFVKETSVAEIQNTLNQAKSFTLRAVDTYDKAYNYTEEELLERLNELREQIETRILETFQTPRKNILKHERELSNTASGEKFFDRRGLEAIERGFIKEVFNDLVKQGKIASGETRYGTGYRSAPEPKKNIGGKAV